ncbi:hypothetical protein HMPREF9141_2016 [Prevotella multiformis DSM 16608]|uniref:Uncharacterized protein n=1 Tax=Prevotella multiformis DSM 16608 TaxID=888743 RepID=F0F8U9_9BACT|nr:hypothetical protein HMPREF9141_2016 [Prevotella multiformis DSM 16608]
MDGLQLRKIERSLSADGRVQESGMKTSPEACLMPLFHFRPSIERGHLPD